MEDYAFTIKFLGEDKADCTAQDYMDVIAYWKETVPKCEIEDGTFEEDSRGRLHMHGIISLPLKTYRKKLLVRGLHCKLVLIYNRAGWIGYIQKDYKQGDEEVCDCVKSELEDSPRDENPDSGFDEEESQLVSDLERVYKNGPIFKSKAILN